MTPQGMPVPLGGARGGSTAEPTIPEPALGAAAAALAASDPVEGGARAEEEHREADATARGARAEEAHREADAAARDGASAPATVADSARAPTAGGRPAALGAKRTAHQAAAAAATEAALRRRPEPPAGAAPPPPPPPPPQLLSVAPMMDWTDVHYRQLARFLSASTWLYTEMVVDKTLLHNPCTEKFLLFPPEQHPIVCQLGGSEPATVAWAAELAALYGYDEVNLNCGCPSDRVAGAGCFGASLMLEAERVRDCTSAAIAAVARAKRAHPDRVAPHCEVSVKCRIGVDDRDSYDELCRFVHVVSGERLRRAERGEGRGLADGDARPEPALAGSAGEDREPDFVRHFIVHARKCHLKGLNPHQNRTIPPLRYGWVYALARDFPDLRFSINGGVRGLRDVRNALRRRDESEAGGSGDAEPEEGKLAGGGAAEGGAEATAEGGPLWGALDRDGLRGGAPACAERAPPTPDLLGAMVGRAAYHSPWEVLAGADRQIFASESNPATAVSRRAALAAYERYCDDLLEGWPEERTRSGWQRPTLRALVKPLLGMFAGVRGGKRWRAAVDGAVRDPAVRDAVRPMAALLEATLGTLPADVLDSPPEAQAMAPRAGSNARFEGAQGAKRSADGELKEGGGGAAHDVAGEGGADPAGAAGSPSWGPEAGLPFFDPADVPATPQWLLEARLSGLAEP